MDHLPPGWVERYRTWLAQTADQREHGTYADDCYRTYPWVSFHDAPLVRPVKQISEMCVAVVSSAGITLPGQPPFDDMAPLAQAMLTDSAPSAAERFRTDGVDAVLLVPV